MADLRARILAEEENITATLYHIDLVLARDDYDAIATAALASFLHNVYNGIENILKQILKQDGGSVSGTPEWHKQLLLESVNHHSISNDTAECLFEYLAFRHFFVHGYSFPLDPVKVAALAKTIRPVWAIFREEIGRKISL